MVKWTRHRKAGRIRLIESRVSGDLTIESFHFSLARPSRFGVGKNETPRSDRSVASPNVTRRTAVPPHLRNSETPRSDSKFRTVEAGAEDGAPPIGSRSILRTATEDGQAPPPDLGNEDIAPPVLSA